MKPPLRTTGLMLLLTAAAGGRETLGAWDYWAAFRTPAAGRCEAAARPVTTTRGSTVRPFVAVASWPARGIRARLHVRLSRLRPPGTPVRLAIGPRWALLTGEGADAWARTGADPAIVAAMRGGAVLRVESRDMQGRAFADVYRLAGAASAVDAAAIACTG